MSLEGGNGSPGPGKISVALGKLREGSGVLLRPGKVSADPGKLSKAWEGSDCLGEVGISCGTFRE